MSEKIVFITGATSGFGKACAELYGRNGYRLILLGRRTERLHGLAETIGAERCHLITTDVRDRVAIEAAIAAIPQAFRPIDILVNNAGLALGLGPAHEASMEDWEQMVDTNIKGLLYVTRTVLPLMVKEQHGHIINIGSMAGTYPYPGANTYGATKAFVEQFSLNLRADLIGLPIRVTNIEPGMAETEFSLVRFHGNKAAADDVYDGVEPLTAEDVAEAVYWASTRPAHVNINRMELMPVMQAPGALAVARKK